MSTVIESLEQRDLKKRPPFGAGDRVRVHFQVVEGNRKRTQVFEGIVIKRQGSGVRETFTVRKHSFGVGVERTFPVHSPKVEQIEVAAHGAVRRAKLYYLRGKVGKQARVAERRWGIEDQFVVGEEEAEAIDAEGVAVTEAEAEVVKPEEPEEAEEAAESGEGGTSGDAGEDAGAESEGGEPDEAGSGGEDQPPEAESAGTEEGDQGAEAASSDEARG